MADRIPLKANYTGADATSLGEFAAGDTINVSYVNGAALSGHNHSGVYEPADADIAKVDVAQTWTAQQTFKELKETVYELTGTVIDPANGTIQYKTLGENTIFTESLEAGQSLTLMLADGTSYTATWPTMTWVGGTAPILPTSGYAVIVLWKVGTTLYGSHAGDVA